MIKIQSLDNIPDKILDILLEKYKDRPGYRVVDEREKLSFGVPRKYFLIARDRRTSNDFHTEWTFIWIKNGLWQFRYVNVECSDQPGWVDPLLLLNGLVNNKH